MSAIFAALSVAIPSFARTVVSASTGEPIIYASVGVINKNIGTVTDTLGNFVLKIPNENINDSIRISCVGYVAKTFAVKDIKNIPDTIRLEDDVFVLSEVIVKPQTIEHKVAGRKGGGGFLFIEIEGDKAAGQGLAVPLSVKKRAWIKGVGFTVVVDKYTLPSMKLRLNVYEKDGDTYSPLKSVRQIYFNYAKSELVDGLFYYSLPEEICLEEGKYYLEIEFLENFSNGLFVMKSKPMTGKTRFRYASQSDWETLPFGAPIYFEYDNLK